MKTTAFMIQYLSYGDLLGEGGLDNYIDIEYIPSEGLIQLVIKKEKMLTFDIEEFKKIGERFIEIANEAEEFEKQL